MAGPPSWTPASAVWASAGTACCFTAEPSYAVTPRRLSGSSRPTVRLSEDPSLFGRAPRVPKLGLVIAETTAELDAPTAPLSFQFSETFLAVTGRVSPPFGTTILSHIVLEAVMVPRAMKDSSNAREGDAESADPRVVGLSRRRESGRPQPMTRAANERGTVVVRNANSLASRAVAIVDVPTVSAPHIAQSRVVARA
jgi:hypothetical protein